MSLKIISGGQDGVDIAALRAAHDLGIPTGGWMPHGWRTQSGTRPQYASLYGMKESASANYDTRTSTNVEEADATVRIARNFNSAGELSTLRAIRRYSRPHLDVLWVACQLITNKMEMRRSHFVPLPRLTPSGEEATEFLHKWMLRFGKDLTLNVAGNSERTAGGIEDAAYTYLAEEFVLYLEAQETIRGQRLDVAVDSVR